MATARFFTSLIAGVFIAGASQAALVGEWKFEGGTAEDTSGNDHHGTIAGTIESVSGVETGTSALEFGATSGYVNIPMEAFSSVSNEMTISMWTFGDADILGDGATATSAYGSNNRNMLHSHLPWNNGSAYFETGGGNPRNNYKFSDASKYEGQWNHVVVVHSVNADEKMVYINGVQDSPTWTPNGPISGITAFAIGANSPGGANHYYGKIDEFQLYDHAMSATEVSNLYASVEVDIEPTARISASATEGAPPLEVILDGSSSESRANIVSYSWDLGDGTSSSDMIVTNTYDVAGEYMVSLEIEDANGDTNATSIAITVNHFAIADISATPLSGDTPLEVAFDASASTSSTRIVSYDWNFGDGKTGSGAMVTNIYGLAGDYTAQLVVVDENGIVDTNTVAISAVDIIEVELDIMVEGFAAEDIPSFYTDDLAQTEYESSSGTGAEDAAQHARLFNGIIGTSSDGTGTPGTVRLTSANTISINFDISVNADGYDITEISSIAGWNPGGGGRANQGYSIIVTNVDDTVQVLAGPEHWAPNGGDTNFWTKVTFTETSGLAMAQNVKSITFDISEDAIPGGVVIYREFDVLGTPSGEILPVVPTIAFANGTDQLTWATDRTWLYSAQSKSDLVLGEWSTFTNVMGTPPQTTIELPEKDQDIEFYRVIIE